MDSVIKNTKRIFIGVGFIFGIILLLFIINQFILFYDLLNRIHPYLAIGLTAIFALTILYILIRIIVIWVSVPKIAVLADNPTEEEYQSYLLNTIDILKKNKNLRNLNFSEELAKEQIVTEAFNTLDKQSFPLIKRTASEVFLTTAISQNGSLDSIMVLISMAKLVWKLANIYQTRPTFKSMGKLYLQVAGVVFMARTLEEEDLIEGQLEPVIASVIGESFASIVPGAVPIANLIVSSIMEGSINAFLTLRVGIIAQSYLGMEVPQSRNFIKRNSSIQAVGYMGSIVKDNSALVVKKIGKSIKSAGSRTAKRWFGKKEEVTIN